MQLVAGVLAVCKITSYNKVQYKATDLKKDLGWFISFKYDYVTSILFNAIQNIYLVLIVDFTS